MRKVLIGGVAVATLAAAGTALAQAAPPPVPGVQAVQPLPPVPPMRMAPPQTRADVQAHVQRMFAKLDTNHDGSITKAEAEAAHDKMMGDMHAKFAKRWSQEGRPAPDRAAMFDRLDTNKDGSISRQEYLAAKPEVREHRMMVMRNSDGAMPGGAMMRMHGMGMGGRMFDLADANHDGRVTLQEMTTAALQHFDTADANHDGTLTPEERMQMHQRMKADRKPG